ncbi:putative toxin-antitoxin system toxin component, PIN family [Candidatus Pacearchaeota archaeon]|nr:putative toxin-antitoxin system toxin component, PIN family [Candidatus Pacearchaeota archaeon]
MRITTDTNVLISSTFWEGASDKIMQKVENKEVELVLSKELISEFTKVLGYDEIKDKIKDKNLEVRRSVEKIVSISTIVESSQKFEIVKDDPDDNMVINCAAEGDVDYVVTQDNHLLKIKEFKGIKILNPEEFLEIFEKV